MCEGRATRLLVNRAKRMWRLYTRAVTTPPTHISPIHPLTCRSTAEGWLLCAALSVPKNSLSNIIRKVTAHENAANRKRRRRRNYCTSCVDCVYIASYTQQFIHLRCARSLYLLLHTHAQTWTYFFLSPTQQPPPPPTHHHFHRRHTISLLYNLTSSTRVGVFFFYDRKII